MPKPKLGVYMQFSKITAAICVVAASAFAQFHVGARIAGNYNMIWNVDEKISTNDIMKSLGAPDEALPDEQVIIKDMNTLSGMGVTFGLSFLYQATPVFGIQPELLFSYRNRSVKPKFEVDMGTTKSSRNNSYYDDYYDYGGSYYDYDDDYGYYSSNDDDYLSELAALDGLGYGNLELEISQWYFEIPLLFRIQTAPGLFFNLGPVLSINMSSEISVSIVSEDVSEYTASAVFGLIAGLGYSVDLGNGQKLDIDFRFQMGLSSLISDEIEISEEEEAKLDATKIIDPKDFNFGIGIAYWFI